ncbi:hypothetical protein B0T17DRAFT_493193 [Bombardia bombarda]|uniref:Rho-GAP domain-containing protein n=1 Tax=Bombardia bombarda TaxID=252184 RepID=A0AA39WZU6_9PEZI|nr:hypothetical protein B0T17DRAFT_493193 [Bombardia bombarda]
MGRKAAPQPLTLALANSVRPVVENPRVGETVPNPTSPDPKSPRSPRSPFRAGQNKPENGVQPLQLTEVLQQQQQHPPPQQQGPPPPQQQGHRPEGPLDDARFQLLTSPVQQQFDHQRQQREPPAAQQNQGHRHQRNDEEKVSKSGFLFHFGKSSRPADRPSTNPYTATRSETMSRDTDRPALSSKHSNSSYQDHSARKPLLALPSRSDLSLASSTENDNAGTSKKGKPKPFALLGRTRSIKDKDGKDRDNTSPKDSATAPAPAPAPVRPIEPERAYAAAPPPLKTAPIHAHDRSFRDMMSSAVRNHSAERSQVRDVSGSRARDYDIQSRGTPPSFKDTGGPSFFSGLKNSKAAGILSKGFFGGGPSRENAANRELVIDDEHYVLKVINLPLVEQTRRTRISKRLEESRDKTEFWMPAFPWRAIDYLNYKGSEVEGLYRIPGSGPQIKKWQRKFDEDGDVDLFEQTDLYDINIIGSMLKAWLRELPDELFPKASQDRIARECAGADSVPQLLIDELSNLSPFNYYLLFAITCHLSLLLAHSDKNKMDFRNLCICFQPCMKIDAFCFKFLVCDWRDCWKGCKSEARYIEEEYAVFDQPPPKVSEQQQKQQQRSASNTANEGSYEERNLSSSDSSGKHSNRSASEQSKGRLRKKAVPESASANVETTSTISSNITPSSERETTPPRRSGELRPLSPIKPLSPLGF